MKYNKSRLFLVSLLALATAGISFAIRGSIQDDLQTVFFNNSAELMGAAIGIPGLGYAITIAIGSPMLDYLGMGNLLSLSSALFFIGTLVVMYAGSIATGNTVQDVVWIGMLIIGIGWGLVETVINPLIVTLYPEEKTGRLNTLHAWWPGGIIIGGLVGIAVGKMNIGWQGKMAIVLLPAAVTMILCLTSKFPPTERIAAGLPASVMFKEVTKPFFLVWFFAMFLTAASELAPGQWVNFALSQTVHMPAILLLVYVSALMFVMRHFAGPLVHKLSPAGLLWISSLLAGMGLFLLSVANSPVTGLLAATIWGTGVCYMWPTMLAAASERFPRGGALLMGLMGTAGMLSLYFVLPMLGKIYDSAKISLAGGADAFAKMTAEQQAPILAQAGQMSFRYVSLVPVVLLFIFGAIWFYDRSRGGYRAESIAAAPSTGD
ncbi:MAG TPA: MFS transporter [Bryobacteraceae bacterium]